MTIDPNTGNLLFGAESLGPSSQEREFLASTTGRLAKRVKATPNTNWYEFWLPGDSGREIAVNLGFECEGRIIRGTIQFVRSEVRAAGAPGWSRADEDEMKSFHDGWLRANLGDPPYEFFWGSIVSIIEPHWYSARVRVFYGNQG